MQDVILMLINLFLLAFVLTSMFGTGLSLTLPQIVDPLKDWKLVLLALLANFALVPALAYAAAALLGLDDGLRAGLIILAACAGAPFLPKLATIAKGNLALSVGLMTLLMVITVAYAPIVLPFLIPGVSVSPWDIARPLITLMLLPLGVGLLIRAWQPAAAAGLVPTMNQASSISLILMAVLALLIGYRELLAAVGTGAFIASAVLIGGALLIGWVLSTNGTGTRSVMGLGTGQRNISAALLVATTNFTDPEVLLIVLVGSVVGMAILFVAAGFFAKQAGESAVEASVPAASRG